MADDAASSDLQLVASSRSPSSRQSPSREQAARRPSKRILVSAACLSCHRAKTKCDGARPACRRCVHRKTPCHYDVEKDETRMSSLKRKYELAFQENERLWELYNRLRFSSLDAEDLIRHIRLCRDPLSALRAIECADVHAYPASTPGIPSASASPDQGAKRAAIMQKIDSEAIQRCPIKVKAWPWTIVAGDGIVSELVNLVLTHESLVLFCFIDKESFLADMYRPEESMSTPFCSPLLVNIMCAFGTMYSQSVIALEAVTKVNLRQRFFDEFRKLLDRQCGAASITTLQALLIAFSYCSITAQDRAGNMFRYAAAEMYARLGFGTGMDTVLREMAGDASLHRRAAISRVAWGCFILENLIEFLYIQPSLMPPPVVPRYFSEPIKAKSEHTGLDAQCDIAEIFYAAMKYNYTSSDSAGGAMDLETRVALYQRLLKLDRTAIYRDEAMFEDKQQRYFVKAYFHITAVAIFRPIQTMDVALPGGYGTPEDICIQHLSHIMNDIVGLYNEIPPGRGGSGLHIFYALCTTFTLTSRLDAEPRAHAPFTQACYLLYSSTSLWPVASALLQGAKALARQLNVQLPEASLPYLENVCYEQDDRGDIPISYLLPNLPNMFEALSDGSGNTNNTAAELGKIITRWSAMTMND